MTQKVLCYDVGGTKVAAAIVTEEGQITSLQKHIVRPELGFAQLCQQMIQIGQDLLSYDQSLVGVSIASAGPLDPARGLLLDPTNFFSGEGQSWGVLDFVTPISQGLKRHVCLENDAAAAALAEQWLGAAQGVPNSITITLGTGVGIGIIANGQLVRAGRGLHTEFSHIPINSFDLEAPCGCGNYGCIEAYLAGSHFAGRVGRRLKQTQLSGQDVVELAQNGQREVLELFADYAQWLAIACRSLSVVFAPQRIVLAGGFTAAHRFFLPLTQQKLAQELKRYRQGIDLMPELCVSNFSEEAGLLGAAKVWYMRHANQ